jgi:glutamine amidotransferase
MITIVNYGMGNLGSIQNMFKRIGEEVIVTDDLELIARAKKILLPGVGSFDNAMQRVNESGLRDVLNRKALVERVPILGICLGMQLLTRSSEEGKQPGLGWIAASTKRFPALPGLKVPHMGWNVVVPTRASVLTRNLSDEVRFYFVHSYCVQVDYPQDEILKANYGISFAAAVQHDNIYGAQFHPEKSHRFGMQFLKNFAGV